MVQLCTEAITEQMDSMAVSKETCMCKRMMTVNQATDTAVDFATFAVQSFHCSRVIRGISLLAVDSTRLCKTMSVSVLPLACSTRNCLLQRLQTAFNFKVEPEWNLHSKETECTTTTTYYYLATREASWASNSCHYWSSVDEASFSGELFPMNCSPGPPFTCRKEAHCTVLP